MQEISKGVLVIVVNDLLIWGTVYNYLGGFVLAA